MVKRSFGGFASFFLYSLRHFSPSVNASENLVGTHIKHSSLQRGLAWGTKPSHLPNPLPLQMSGRGSRLDRYESVMFRLRLAPSEGQTAASLVAQHKRWFNGGENAARSFFNHPQVVKALDLGGANRTSSGQTKASSTTQNSGKPTADLVNDSFWETLAKRLLNPCLRPMACAAWPAAQTRSMPSVSSASNAAVEFAVPAGTTVCCAIHVPHR